ncbi:hypothetical protein Rcae01_00630 [Novipirellula caenicola]|uniref:Uncharacterized protein n=1 Tax=Novipirellula caenicola TaxID=1536901 RepID=A0ABP9VJ01_9BACT
MKSIILPAVFLLGGSFATSILVAQDPPADGPRDRDAVAKRQTLTTPASPLPRLASKSQSGSRPIANANRKHANAMAGGEADRVDASSRIPPATRTAGRRNRHRRRIQSRGRSARASPSGSPVAMKEAGGAGSTIGHGPNLFRRRLTCRRQSTVIPVWLSFRCRRSFGWPGLPNVLTRGCPQV